MRWEKDLTVAWSLALLLPLMFSCFEPVTSIQAGGRDGAGLCGVSVAGQTQAVSTVHHSGLPKVDEIVFKAYTGATPDEYVQEFIDGETDWIEGPSRSDLYQDVIDAGHKVSEMCPAAEFTFFPINCRDYKYRNGNPNAPLNDSSWRLALSYVYGLDDKQADVLGYYKVPWMQALGNPVPPAQEPWYDASVVMPDTDNETAWSILSGAGYTVQNYSGQPWLHKNGVPVRPPDGPNNGKIILLDCGWLAYWYGPFGGMARNWNAFLKDYVGADGPLMKLSAVDFTSLVNDLLTWRDFDVIGIGLTNLGKYVDWIYTCFHSDNDVPGGWNFCGIHDADFDRWAEIILSSVDVDEVVEATENFTRKFVYELMPWMPAMTGVDFSTTARDSRGELTSIVSMDNYGSMNRWSFMSLHWKGEPDVAWPGGTVIAALEDEPDTLNPWTEDTHYGWQIMDRAISKLLMVDPVSLFNMPWIANDWEVAYWTSIPELGIEEGSTATFWLRQDVTWHDGYPVTAYDCVANMRFIREEQPRRYSSTWTNLVYEEADGPYKFNTYHSKPGLYMADYVAKAALFVPKHVIEVVEDYWDDWEPCFKAYEDLGLGPAPAEYPFMKQLVGCGPFVFDYYDRREEMGRVVRYQDFFVNAPVIGSVVGEWRIDPGADYVYKPLVQNVAAMEADENGTLTSVAVDVMVFEDDVLAYEVDCLVLDPWAWTYLGPYTMSSVSCGCHNVTVEVYDHTDSSLLHRYVNVFAVTVREDLTTYTGELADLKVDMRDVGRAARAFGSVPGHPRWDPACDVNDDFKVDMRDIGSIARRFGWTCP